MSNTVKTNASPWTEDFGVLLLTPFKFAWGGFVCSRIYLWFIAPPLALPLLGWKFWSGALLVTAILSVPRATRTEKDDDERSPIARALLALFMYSFLLACAWIVHLLTGGAS